jgi:tetratricopeptide (TPR) repeat protein
MKLSMTMRCLTAALVLLAIGFITYGNSLHHSFVLDDHEFFDNPRTDIHSILQEFVPPHARLMGPGVYAVEAYYRPLAHVLPLLSYKVFGTNVQGHHAVNLALLIFASMMIYLFIRKITERDSWAFGTAVFYLVHPINGILVNHVAASVFSAQVIFMLAALCFLESLPFSILFFILALMCHETAMALPFYVLALLLIFYKYSFKEALLKALPLFVFLIGYFIFRLKFASLNTGIFANYAFFHMNIGEYLASVAKLIFWYISQLLSPGAVVPIWATAVVRQAVGWWFVTLIVLITGWAVVIYRLKNRPFSALGLTWLGIGFIPLFFACLFQPTRALIIEPHWFIFSEIGFFILLASLFKSTKLSLIFALLLLIPWIVISRSYNTLWSNEVSYCQYWMQNAPDFRGAISFELAQAYDLQGQYALAQKYYRQGLTPHPNDWLRYHSRLGLMALKQGKWQEAQEHFIQALEIDPHSAVNLNNAGAVYLQQGSKIKARQYFLDSISEDPYFLLPRLNLAEMYGNEGDWQKALQAYHAVLKIKPHDEMALIHILKIYWDQKDKNNIITTAKELAANSNSPLTQRNVRIILQSLN